MSLCWIGTRDRAILPTMRWMFFLALAMLVAVPVGCSESPTVRPQAESEYVKQREAMVAMDIEARGVTNRAVLKAVRDVPRHEFVSARYRRLAYADQPLPIEAGQTISQPYIVAAMTEAVRPQPDDVVLEVGTGSGYQAAVLSGLVRHVYTIEIVNELAEAADAKLSSLGYDNVTVKAGDGYLGWPEHAPFDAIVVTAAPDHVPQPLLDQLKPGGRLVIPVGPTSRTQELRLLEKDAGGNLRDEVLMPVRFVPLTGEHAERR